MRRKSTRSVTKGRRKDSRLGRPFDPKVWEQARRLASRYALILEPEAGVGYVGSAVELPNVFADGPTAEACVQETITALTGVVARMLETGKAPPTPTADAEQRDVQLNIRVSAREKLLIEKNAKAKGFRGVSDYLRTVAVGDRS
jgi:predicted RNase H-like HicB family nuclease